MSTIPYVTTPEIARRLDITDQTVRRLVAEEGLPAHRVARRLLFLADEVDAWVRTRASSHRDPLEPPTAAPPPADEWVADQVAKFSPDDLRRAAAVLLSLAGDRDAAGGAA